MSDQVNTPEDDRRERVGEAQALALEGIESHLEELHEILKRQQQPPEIRLLEFTLAVPQVRVDPTRPSLSISVLNPSAATILVGIGSAASVSSRAISVRPGSMLTLPVSADQFELAVDPAELAGGPVVAYLLRYDSVQPAFVGGLS